MIDLLRCHKILFRLLLVMAEEGKTIQQELSLPILLADRVRKSAEESESSRPECSEIARQVDRLSTMLRSAVRLAAANPAFYDRPLRRIAANVTKNLRRALTLVRKRKHGGLLRHVFVITTSADFRKVSNLLESSIGDMKWLLSIFDSDGTEFSLPPIVSDDPNLACVWSNIASLQMGQIKTRVDAANELASWARDNDRNKKLISEEGGVPPLLKLLKESISPEGQIAAATALFNLCIDESVRLIAKELGVPIIVRVLSDSPTRVQSSVANLVSKMADLEPIVQEEFARENVIRPLISLLSMNTVLDDPKLQSGNTGIHSIVQISKELVGKNPKHTNSSSSFVHSNGNVQSKKEREIDTPELRRTLKTSCAEALWKLSKGCESNSRKIIEAKGLLCLAKLIEKEQGELQINCLMTVMEIASVVELNPDIRIAAFKTNAQAAKAILDQLLRVIQEESDPKLRIPAIKSIGSLARTFPARETRIIAPLIAQLSNRSIDVAIEAAIALKKFVCPENYLHVEHSKAIIESNGVPPLIGLVGINEQTQLHGLVLLCYLALHVGNSKALEQARALNTLEGSARHVVAQHPELRDLFARAIHHLILYQAGVHPHKQSLPP